MSIDSLKNMCYKKLATDISNSPPLIQEMIIQNTTEYIRDEIMQQIEKKIVYKITNIYNSIIPILLNLNDLSVPPDRNNYVTYEIDKLINEYNIDNNQIIKESLYDLSNEIKNTVRLNTYKHRNDIISIYHSEFELSDSDY